MKLKSVRILVQNHRGGAELIWQKEVGERNVGQKWIFGCVKHPCKFQTT